MANTGSGNTKKLNPGQLEQLFEAFYNQGQRRTYIEVANATQKGEIAGIEACSYDTVLRYAHEFDWSSRADSIDGEMRAIRDSRLADLVAKQRVQHVNLVAALTTKFHRRIIPSVEGNPNPFEIQPGDIEIGDAVSLIKLFELLTGGATERTGEEGPSRLDEMEQAILGMDARETERPALTAGEGGN